MPPKRTQEKTYTSAQVAAIKDQGTKRAKYAWGKVYNLHGELMLMTRELTEFFSRSNGRLQRPAANPEGMPNHITDKLFEMASRLNESYTCPICFDLTTRDSFHLTPCGHHMCKGCLAQITECPICRRALPNQ